MSKKISIENYSRRRGLISHTVKMTKTTASGKLASEYFELLKLTAESPQTGMQAFLGKVEELKQMQK